MNTMRPTRSNARLPLAAVLGTAIAAVALAGPARAADDSKPIDEQILHTIMTNLGLQDPNAPQPTYEERPPLVIPKSDSLPAPQKAGSAVAKNPAWPKDPDIARAKLLAKQEKNRDLEAERLHDRNPLPPNEIGPKYPSRRAGRTVASGSGASDTPDFEGDHRMSPSQLGYGGGLFGKMFGSDDNKEQTARFTGEPARTSLTEPPPGYQTPSPDQPYGLGKADTKPKADNYYLTHGEAKN